MDKTYAKDNLTEALRVAKIEGSYLSLEDIYDCLREVLSAEELIIIGEYCPKRK